MRDRDLEIARAMRRRELEIRRLDDWWRHEGRQVVRDLEQLRRDCVQRKPIDVG